MGHFKAVTIDMLSLIDTLLWKQNFVVDVVASKSEEKFMFKDEGSSLQTFSGLNNGQHGTSKRSIISVGLSVDAAFQDEAHECREREREGGFKPDLVIPAWVPPPKKSTARMKPSGLPKDWAPFIESDTAK